MMMIDVKVWRLGAPEWQLLLLWILKVNWSVRLIKMFWCTAISSKDWGYWMTSIRIQFNSDICTRQLINYHVGARDEHRKHDPQVGDFKKKSEFSI